MTFLEILEYAEKGEKIRRKAWDDKKFYIGLIAILVNTHFKDNSGRPAFLELLDYKADDWEVYDDREYFDFHQALKHLEEGKSIARKAWKQNGSDYYIFKNKYENKLSNNRAEREHFIRDEGLFANDWYIV